MSEKCPRYASVKMRDCAYNKHMDRVGAMGTIDFLHARFRDPSTGKVCRYDISFENGESDFFTGYEFDVIDKHPVKMEVA